MTTLVLVLTITALVLVGVWGAVVNHVEHDRETYDRDARNRLRREIARHDNEETP